MHHAPSMIDPALEPSCRLVSENIGFGGAPLLRFAHGFKICARSGAGLPYYTTAVCSSYPGLWCSQLESRGTSLEKFLYRSIRLHHAKLGCFGGLTVRSTCCTRNIFKKRCAIGEIDIFPSFGPILYEGSMGGGMRENADLLSAISISGRLVTRRSNFLQSHITLITDYALCAKPRPRPRLFSCTQTCVHMYFYS
jgi:hypothetical protein